MFNVGDFVTGMNEGRYCYTNSKAYMIVTSVRDDSYFNVKLLARVGDYYGTNLLGHEFDNLEMNNFVLAPSFEEWASQHSNVSTVSDINNYFKGGKMNTTTSTTELKMIKNEYNIPTEQLEYYKKEIMDFLPKFRYKEDRHYNPTEKGVDAILAEYNKMKGWMYPYFMSHPNYVGNGKIAFSSDYHRKVNAKGVKEFINWVKQHVIDYYVDTYQVRYCDMTYKELKGAVNRLDRIFTYMGEIEQFKIGQAKCNVKVNGMSKDEIGMEYARIANMYHYIESHYNYVCINGNTYYLQEGKRAELYSLLEFLNIIKDEPHMLVKTDEVDTLNSYTKCLDLRIVAGQKFSRVIGKFCRKLEIDKRSEYGQMFAKLGDDINELDIKRHTVISINPIDYYTMSFGNSWSSCHTIDKMNDRRSNGQHYQGAYSGGTESYMLDGASIVFYTVDSRYDGTDFEFQPKVNRCMFHLGEDKLIQGRVYPQSNDGDDTIYNEIRAIMQKVVSEMFAFNNLWFIKRGCSECDHITTTQGRHYPDYIHFNTCNVSYIKPEEGKAKNVKRIIIGHRGICPTCGESHNNSSAIICDDCFNNVKRCPHCNSRISDSDEIEINGQIYCSHCAQFCDYHQRYEVDTDMMCIFTRLNRIGYVRVCRDAVIANPTRYRRDYYDGRIYDTSVYTEGIVTGEGYYIATLDRDVRNPERGYHNAERDWKIAYNGKYYHKDNIIYDRRSKQWVPTTEWDNELNCWNGVSEQVRQHNETLARRAERRAEREARRAMENVA